MRVRAILALAVAGLWLVVVAPASSASAAAAYPPIPCPTLSVSTTSPLEGATMTVSGKNFVPSAAVRIELHSKVYVLAELTTKTDGSFSVKVKLPDGVSGNHTIVAVGGTANGATGCPADPIQAIVIHQIGGVSSSPGGSNGGGTAFTGVDVLALLAAAGVLLAAGLMLNRRGSAKRAAARY